MSGKRSATGAATAAPLPQVESNLVQLPKSAAELSEVSVPADFQPDDRFEYVPLGMVYVSDTNPRRNFDEKGMADLTANVRAHGVLEPLIVRQRPREGTALAYEIVAGARRFRAASAAGLEAVPVIIKRLTDEQMLELQLIENLHRTDLHPLEEANGYKQLIEQIGLDVASLTARTGRPGALPRGDQTGLRDQRARADALDRAARPSRPVGRTLPGRRCHAAARGRPLHELPEARGSESGPVCRSGWRREEDQHLYRSELL
jgi:ParB/RepB/Spo0J family partition protein